MSAGKALDDYDLFMNENINSACIMAFISDDSFSLDSHIVFEKSVYHRISLSNMICQ